MLTVLRQTFLIPKLHDWDDAKIEMEIVSQILLVFHLMVSMKKRFKSMTVLTLELT